MEHELLAFFIVFFLWIFFVVLPINFDDQAQFWAVKISNIPTNSILASKLQTKESSFL